jgi:large subunit ribosomal protein L7/L12
MMPEYSPTVTALGDRIAALAPAEAKELRQWMKDTLAVEAAGGPAPPPQEEAPPPADVQTEFDVVLDAAPPPTAKIACIKVVREILGLGLKEAKEFVEGTPKTVKEGVTKAEALACAAQFEQAGHKVTVK